MKEIEDVTGLLQALVRIPSVNPDGETGTDQVGEQAIAEFVGEFLRSIGATVRLEEVLPGRPNVIGSFPTTGDPNKPKILLAPHLDTVGVGGMTVDPFGAEIRDGKLYGRGACDTKGTMAAMLWALKEHGADAIARLGAEVTFVAFCGEETAQPGSHHFAKKHAAAYDFAVIGEPTDCDIVHKHKGTVWATLLSRGSAAHGSKPELGENAIMKLITVLQALDGDFRERIRSEEYADPVLGTPTINIGMVRGGTRPNIVPDECCATIDLRVTPALAAADPARILREFVAEASGGQVEVEIDLQTNALDTDAANPFIQKLTALPGSPKCVGASWFCDAAVLADAGIPGVAAGPGSIDQAHTRDEWIELSALHTGVTFYQDFLKAL
ncbi:MAG: acetylornithine deacetylase/succinyl-diaminopimelate desuccinylase family protein [Verrucomicrobiales bacterium]|jgi:acetylornithine deacetylase/succinyl-diaminopimelate desuccinylase family protein